MSAERINGIRMNLELATQQELETIAANCTVRELEATTDRMLVEDYYFRRFGEVALEQSSVGEVA